MIFLQTASVVKWIVRLPVNKGVMRWEWERCCIEWINMCPHSIIFFLRNKALCFNHLPHPFIIIRYLILLYWLLSFVLPFHKRNILFQSNIYNQHSLIRQYKVQLDFQFGQDINNTMQHQLQILQHIAHQALTATDYQIKTQAEIKWQNLMLSASEQQIKFLLREGSQTILFLVALVLLKNYQSFKYKNGILVLINQQMIEWYQLNGSFVRNGIEIELHISNSFGDYTASILKQFLIDHNKHKDALEFLDILAQKPKYMVFILLKSIEMVSLVDNSMGFVKYKALIQTFQQKITPIILQKLVYFFLSIIDNIQQTQLASLQESLTFNDQSSVDLRQYMLEFTKNNRFIETIFKLLEEILDFKYNLHFTQYDDMFNYSNFFVAYPDIVLKKLINEEFLTALYKIIAHLMKLPHFHKYLCICLKSLKKVLLAKLKILSEAERLKVLEVHFNGLNHLLELLHQKQVAQEKSGLQIIESTLKMLSIQDFDKFVNLSHQSLLMRPKLQRWLQLTRQLPLMILNNDKNITSQNELLLKSTSLMYEIGNVMQITKITAYKNIFMISYHNYTKLFLQSIIFSKIDLQSSQAQRKIPILLNQIDDRSKQIFLDFRFLLTYNYQQSFKQLISIVGTLYSNMNSPGIQYSWGNLITFSIYLLTDNKIYQNSIFGEHLVTIYHRRNVQCSNPQSLDLISTFIFKVLSFILQYCQLGMKSKYLNNSIILFLNVYLQRCVEHIDSKNKSQEYKNENYEVLDFLHKLVMRNIPVLKDDEFILNLIKTYLNFLYIENEENVEYILTSLYKIISQFKRSTKDVFFNTKVYTELYKCFQSLCQMNIPNHLIKCNTQIYQIITLLLLDNSLQSCKRNMKSIMAILINSIQRKTIGKVLYDLIGILQSLQESRIFNKFTIMMMKDIEINELMNLFAQMIEAEPIYMKDVLHFCYLLISNKANRLEERNLLLNTYNLIKMMLPLWNYCLKRVANIKNSKFNIQQVLNEFCNILECILTGNAINIYVLEANFHMKVQFNTFIKEIISNYIFYLDNISDSPDICLKIMKSAKDMMVDAQKLCFNSVDIQLALSLEALVVKVITIINQHFQSILSFVFDKLILEQMLNTLVRYFEFMVKYSKRKHLINIQKNIASIMPMNENLKRNLLLVATKIGLTYGSKANDILLSIAKLFVKLVIIYNLDSKQIIELLELKLHSDQYEISLIIDDIKKQPLEEYWMAGRVKDWLKNENRYFSYENIDY